MDTHVTPELQPKDTVDSKETLLVVMAVVEAQDGGQEKLAGVLMELGHLQCVRLGGAFAPGNVSNTKN